MQARGRNQKGDTTMYAKRAFALEVVLAIVTSTTLLISCAGRKDTISRAERTEQNAPGIEETKAIADFIYGLPIVMNYAVMYEYVVDRNSGQWKAPFNQIANEARVYT
jgi:hypothetical protein